MLLAACQGKLEHVSEKLARRPLTHRKRIAHVQLSTIDFTLSEAKRISSSGVIFSGRFFGMAQIGSAGKTSAQQASLVVVISIKIVNKIHLFLADSFWRDPEIYPGCCMKNLTANARENGARYFAKIVFV
jgi:hypothetical protein